MMDEFGEAWCENSSRPFHGYEESTFQSGVAPFLWQRLRKAGGEEAVEVEEEEEKKREPGCGGVGVTVSVKAVRAGSL